MFHLPGRRPVAKETAPTSPDGSDLFKDNCRKGPWTDHSISNIAGGLPAANCRVITRHPYYDLSALPILRLGENETLLPARRSQNAVLFTLVCLQCSHKMHQIPGLI